MNGLQRFDREGGDLTDEELRRRWSEFHRSIHQASGHRLRGAVVTVLGENTLRRRIFEALTRVVRDRSHRAPLPVAPRPAVFPADYRPPVPWSASTPWPERDDVAVVEVDERDDPRPTIASLNHALRTTTAKWLAITSHRGAIDDLRRLHEAASADDAVVFADEPGPDASPILKSPEVGPHTLLSYDCVGRPALMRVATLLAIGGFSTDAGWAFEHDAYLRLHEMGAAFHHVPFVAGTGSAVEVGTNRGDDTTRVVAAALARRGWSGTAENDSPAGVTRWRIDVPFPVPSIDLIIPTRDRLDLLTHCLESIEKLTTYPNYRVIILDNDSVEPATLEFLSTTRHRVIACPGPFNYAKIVNRGIEHSTADYVVTLNNDTLVITPDWLEQMVGLAALPDVGVVGVCLIDQFDRHEHDGVVIAPYPQHLRLDVNYPHHDRFIAATRDVAAVTGAAQMVHREFWQHLGGMDEEFGVVMNDVDLCLRAQLEDRYVVFTPHVRLYHHASSSRGRLDPLEDRNRFVTRWDIFGSFRDPFFPESLQLLGGTVHYRPASPPEQPGGTR